MSTRAQRQGERDAVMRRIYALGPRDQLEVHRLLSQHLGDELGNETEFAKQARERREALEGMRRVASHLGLAAGDSPNVTQHRSVSRAITGDWTASRVIRAWGRYRLAERAFRNERIELTAAQRSLRRYSGGSAHAYEQPLAGVRKWLRTRPASMTAKDYDAYVREHNSYLVSGENTGLAMIQASQVRARLGVLWKEVLLIAKSEGDHEQLRTNRQNEKLEADSGPLGAICASTIGVLLGISKPDVYRIRQRDDFPRAVVRVGHRIGWLRADVLAYRAGESFPERQEWEMQSLIISCEELATKLDLQTKGVHSAVTHNRTTVPPPDGRLGDAYYWLRDSVEQWLLDNADRPAIRHRTRFRLSGSATAIK